MIPYSVLDLSPIVAGGDCRAVASPTRSISPAMPKAGATRRYWLAEHHNMPGIASAATAVVIGHVAARHQDASASAPAASCCPTIRRWSSPSSSARWPALYPGRIDLGLGRAPGTDQMTARALRRDVERRAEQFPARRASSCRLLLGRAEPGQHIRAVPGAGYQRADLDSRLQPLRRAARRPARPALLRSPRISRPTR